MVIYIAPKTNNPIETMSCAKPMIDGSPHEYSDMFRKVYNSRDSHITETTT